MKSTKIIIISVLSFIGQFNLYAQNNEHSNNHFSTNAISQAVGQYHQQESVGYKKYSVICMKIMSINETSGEFVLTYIFYDYKYLNLTHYIHVNNELVLIKVDSLCKADLVKYGINKITEAIKKEALDILPGHGMSITGRDAPLMVFKYDKNCIEGKFFDGYTPPAPQKNIGFKVLIMYQMGTG